MTNREEIEKKFDERFPDGFHEHITVVDIKSFFLDEILPEVLDDFSHFQNLNGTFSVREIAQAKYNIKI